MTPNPPKWQYFRKLGYAPRSAQLVYHRAAETHRYLGTFAYPRAGKSEGAAKEVGATVRLVDHRCWIVAPTYDLGSKEFGYIWNDHARLGLLDKASRRAFDVRGGALEIVYPWGWLLRVRTTENPLTLLAEELDELILAEGAQVPETIWDRYLSARTKVRKGRVHIPTTPKGMNWLYERFYLPGRAMLDGKKNPAHQRDYWSATVSHLRGQKVGDVTLPKVGDLYQGGVYADEEMAEALRSGMPMDTFLEQFGGQFVSYSGLVYKGINKARHGCAPFVVPMEWDVLLGIDPGAGADPTAIVFGAWDLQTPRHLWLWGLVYEKGKAIQYYADRIAATLSGRRPYAIVVDTSEKQFRIELATGHGLGNTAPHSRQLQDRYVALTGLIETDRLHVFDTPELAPWWMEAQRYAWKEGFRGEIRYDAVTGPDHAMDATGYLALVPGPWHDPVERDPLGDVQRRHDGLPALSDSERRQWQEWEERRQIHAARFVNPDQDPEILAFDEEEEVEMFV